MKLKQELKIQVSKPEFNAYAYMIQQYVENDYHLIEKFDLLVTGTCGNQTKKHMVREVLWVNIIQKKSVKQDEMDIY